MTTKTVEIRTIIYANHCLLPFPADSISNEQWSDLAEQTRAALSAAHPEATVEIEIRHGVSGLGSETTYSIDGEKDFWRSVDCRAIAEKAWERWCATTPSESAVDVERNDEQTTRRWTITTDAVTTTIEADDEDEAARKFAASEGLDGIESVDDLRDWAIERDGWCRISEVP